MAGTLLRQARKRARLSQVNLAARAGVAQSVISAYESGQRQPSIPALARLIDAAGFELTLGLRRSPSHLRRLSGPVGRRVRRHRNDLVAAAAAHRVSNLRVFGSVARGEDHPGSDVDLLADFPPGLSLSEYPRDLPGLPVPVSGQPDRARISGGQPHVRLTFTMTDQEHPDHRSLLAFHSSRRAGPRAGHPDGKHGAPPAMTPNLLAAQVIPVSGTRRAVAWQSRSCRPFRRAQSETGLAETARHGTDSGDRYGAGRSRLAVAGCRYLGS